MAPARLYVRSLTEKQRKDAAPKWNFVPLHAPTLSPATQRQSLHPTSCWKAGMSPGMFNLTPFPASRLVLWHRPGGRPKLDWKSGTLFFWSLSVWIVTREESCDVAPLRSGRLLKATVHANNVRLHEEHCGEREIRSTCAAVRCLHDAAVSRACTNRFFGRHLPYF